VDSTLLALMLVAAVLHAGWNLLVKMSRDMLAVTVLLMLVGGALSLIAIPFFPAPAWASLPYLAGSVCLQCTYSVLLVRAYGAGDFGRVYPIARGLAPLLVTLVSTTLIGESFGRLELAGVLVIALGVVSLVFADRAPLTAERRSLFYALASGVTIGAYTILDGLGARLSGIPKGYVFWIFAANMLPMTAILVYGRGREALRALRSEWRRAVIAAVMALSAYGMVIYALSAAPMGPVAALRETSVVFAALLGALVLKERFGAWRIASAAIVALGLLLLRL